MTITDEVGCTIEAEFEVTALALGLFDHNDQRHVHGDERGLPTFSDWRHRVRQEYELAYLDTAGNPVNLNNLSEMVYMMMTDQVGCTYVETFEIGVDEVTDMLLTIDVSRDVLGWQTGPPQSAWWR